MDPILADGQQQIITENDLAALRSFGYVVNADQTAPAAPTITKASLSGKKLKLKGTGFSEQVEVEVNGRVVAPPIEIKVNGSGKKLQIKADQSDMNLQSSINQLQVISNGVSSNTFAFNQ